MILTILSGILLSLAFPKTSFHLLAWIALIPFLYAIKRSKDIKLGLLLGLVFFGLNLAWITSLSDYIGIWSYLSFLGLIIFQSLYFVAVAFLIKLIYTKFNKATIILIPLAWTLIEWIRTLTPFGVAAGGLGYTQVQVLPILQIASVFSIYGISFLIVLINLLIFSFLESLNQTRKAIILALVTIVLFGGIYYWGHLEINKEPKSDRSIKISLIQPNISQEKKLSSNYNSFSINRLFDLTKQAAQTKPDIIIWPETAITIYLLDNPVLLKDIKSLAKEANAYLVLGIPYYVDEKHIYNSLIAISPDGKTIGPYSKQHPVPFGEYLPFRPLLKPFLKSIKNFFDYDYSGDPNPKLIEIKNIKFGPLICFESTFSSLASQRSRQGAQVLLAITNDAWFNDSSALEKHFNMGIMRAVENRKYFIQGANTGISGVVDPYGRVRQKSKINNIEILTFNLPINN